MDKLIEVKIDSLRVSLTNQQRIVVLKELDGDRYLPIWIGPYEAEAITIAVQEIEISRPQTHDLVKNSIDSLGARVVRIVISDLRDDIFFGTLVLQRGDEEVSVDCRPSDAIAVAVRAHAPIMVSSDVMEQASIVPEELTLSEEEQTGESEPGGGDRQPPGDDRLSIFEEYLKKKKSDDNPDDAPNPSPQ